MTEEVDWMDDESYYLEECAKLKLENKKLKKKLDVAVKALEWYAQPDESLAQEALKQIKEIK